MVTIHKATREEIGSFNIREWHNVDFEHYGKPVEWNEEKFIYKAEENGEIVGTATGSHESGVVYVDGLLVAKNKRGLGIGKKLMEFVEEFGRKHNAHKIHLITGKGWDSEKFYIALGYTKIVILPKHHFKRDFIVYEKFI
jgi:GNAT superfamily N-acetyltransferase